ncbi:ATP-binding protein [Nocardioides phosphati]|uniref:ATP-binding protein n=1 Tax=Nocardioides phosphati TaxID=1867775 RepID=A0ABQ2N7E3_9ACTN|nr:DUF3107 domain-containing protein [Nocardioides phosphati]GGO84823.1 ATP-binding protein [Nocardioides phosphati]
MEIKIGIQNVVREVVIETNETPDAVEKQVSDAINNGGVLNLTDGRGRRVVIPVSTLAYVDFGGGVQGHVGFRS